MMLEAGLVVKSLSDKTVLSDSSDEIKAFRKTDEVKCYLQDTKIFQTLLDEDEDDDWNVYNNSRGKLVKYKKENESSIITTWCECSM